MILAFSTSSSVASVAIIDAEGSVAFAGSSLAPTNASGALISLMKAGLADLDLRIDEMQGFAADTGPGSFIGVRVGIVMAKTLAELNGKLVAGATAFDLINPDELVAIPNRKADWLLRIPGSPPILVTDVPPEAIGYRLGRDDQHPAAAGFASLLDTLVWQTAVDFVPEYEVPPSISQPKKTFGAWSPA